MKILALDDEQASINLIENYCSRIDAVKSFVGFTSSIQAAAYLKTNKIDVVFLDINMPSISGLDFAKQIPYPVMLIFATAYENFAHTAFELEATDYLLKPYSFERFETAIQKVLKSKNANYKSISFKLDYGIIHIELAQIQWVEAYDDYVKIHCADQSTKVIRSTMKNMENRLEGENFVRIHKSYLVAFSQIREIRNRKVFLTDRALPIGPKYYDEVKNRLNSTQINH